MIKCEQYNRVCVLTPGDEFTVADVQTARQTVESALEAKRAADFVFDLERVRFLDSAALETLLWIKREAERLSGQVKLANVDDNCRSILRVTRLEDRFDCHRSLAAAVKTIR